MEKILKIIFILIVGTGSLLSQDVVTSCDQNKDKKSCEKYEGCEWMKFEQKIKERSVVETSCTGTLIRIRPQYSSTEKTK